jgi:hypothetical protein
MTVIHQPPDLSPAAASTEALTRQHGLALRRTATGCLWTSAEPTGQPHRTCGAQA